MGLLKWLFRIVLVLIVLIAAAIFLVPKFLDPNDYKDELADIVRKQTGRALVIDGDLKLSVFPWIGVNTNKMTLSQPNHLSKDFGGGNMLDVESAEIRVQTMPLLKSVFAEKKDIRVATIKLKNPVVNLITTKKGLSSLDGLTGDSPSPVKGDTDKAAAGAGAALVVQGVALSDGLLIWDDRQAGQRYELKDFNLNTGNLLGKNLQKIAASGVLLDSSTPDITNFSLKGKARVNQDTLTALAEGFDLSVDRGVIKAEAKFDSLSFVKDGLIGLNGLNADINFNDPEVGPLKANIEAPSVSFQQAKGLLNLAAGLSAKGSFKEDPFDAQAGVVDFDMNQMKASVSSINAQGKFEKEPFKLNSGQFDFDIKSMQGGLVNLVANGGFQGNRADLTAEKVGFNVDKQSVVIDQFSTNGVIAELAGLKQRPFKALGNSLQADMSKQSLSLAALSFVSQDLKGSLSNIKGSKIIDKPRVSGALDVDPFNLRQLLQELAVDYAPQKAEALTSVGLSGRFSGGLESVDLKDLNVKLDDSSLTGRLGVQDFENPNATFNVVLDKLNMDDYLPPSEEGSAKDESVGAEALAVPLAVFEQFKANGKLRINEFKGAGLKVDRIAVDVKSAGNTTTITPSAKLYEGSFDGTAKYEKTSTGGRLSLKQKLKSINLLGLLTDLDFTNQLSGIGNLGVDLVIEDINGKQTNRGKITVGALDGALKGVDIQKILSSAENAYNSYKGKQLKQDSKYNDETKFASLNGTFEMNDYKLDNLDFDMKAPLFRVSGRGEVDIAKQILDYTVSVAVVDSLRGQGGASLDKLRGITVPIRFTGDLTSPKYSVDMKALVKSLAGKKIDDKLNAAVSKKLGIDGASEKGSKGVVKALANKKLEEKYGVKSDGGSSKDILGGLLQKKLQDKYGRNEPQVSNQSPDQPVNAYPDSEPSVNESSSQPVAEPLQQAQPELTKEQRKQQAKDQLKKQLLESLFK